jgi:hypothetical protein
MVLDSSVIGHMKSRIRFTLNFNSIASLEGIVLGDWGRLQMVLLDISEVLKILFNVYFKFKLHFKLEIFQKGVRPGTL